MKREPTRKELELATQINDLEEAATRPVIMGGGLLAGAVNFLVHKVARGAVLLCLGLFIVYHAWQAFNSSQQLFAQLQLKRAEAGLAIAEAISLNEQSGKKTNAQGMLESEIQKSKADADSAEAELEASRHSVDGMPAKLAKIRADIAKAQADADAAKAEADAQNQLIGGLPAATAQKKAEVEDAESKLRAKLASLKTIVRLSDCFAHTSLYSAYECK